jgi:hypothetical protein
MSWQYVRGWETVRSLCMWAFVPGMCSSQALFTLSLCLMQGGKTVGSGLGYFHSLSWKAKDRQTLVFFFHPGLLGCVKNHT